jgi:predicted DNA-binding protein
MHVYAMSIHFWLKCYAWRITLMLMSESRFTFAVDDDLKQRLIAVAERDQRSVAFIVKRCIDIALPEIEAQFAAMLQSSDQMRDETRQYRTRQESTSNLVSDAAAKKLLKKGVASVVDPSQESPRSPAVDEPTARTSRPKHAALKGS